MATRLATYLLDQRAAGLAQGVADHINGSLALGLQHRQVWGCGTG